MISRLSTEMSNNLLLMRVLVPMAPLLGLVGTVSGMLEVFDSMALRGSADARTMATGVSHAMLCTMTGLAVSITGYQGISQAASSFDRGRNLQGTVNVTKVTSENSSRALRT